MEYKLSTLEAIFDNVTEEIINDILASGEEQFDFEYIDEETGWEIRGSGVVTVDVRESGDGYWESRELYIANHDEQLREFEIIHYDEESDTTTRLAGRTLRYYEKLFMATFGNRVCEYFS